MVKARNIFRVFVSTLTICLFVLSLYILIAGTVAVRNNKAFSMFGYTLSVVPTNSMEPDIKVGDTVIGHKVSYDDLKVGDDVIYYSDTNKIFIVHRIIRKDDQGYKTMGINPSITTEDADYVTKDNYVAKVIWNGEAARLGTFIIEHRNVLFLGIFVIMLLIAINGVFDVCKILEEKKKLQQEEQLRQLESRKINTDVLRQEILDEIKEEHHDNFSGPRK